MNASPSAALSASRITLHILIVLNGLMGAVILALLLVSPNERWIMAAFDLTPSPDTDRLIMGLRAVAALGVVGVLFNHVVLRRLLTIVRTVSAGDPFVTVNAERLRVIGWALLGLQVLAVAIGAIGKSVSTAAHPVHLDAGFSTSGWLAVLLTFALAGVFAEGARMRDDLEGTV